MRKIEEYTNLIFGESTQPKPKNWSRKTYTCYCNIPIFQKDRSDILGRIDVEYTVEPTDESVYVGGHNKTNWWMKHKPKKWKITHLKPIDFGDIKYTIHIGHIERGGAITPSPIYISVEDMNKYNAMVLKQDRKKKLKNLMNGTL